MIINISLNLRRLTWLNLILISSCFLYLSHCHCSLSVFPSCPSPAPATWPAGPTAGTESPSAVRLLSTLSSPEWLVIYRTSLPVECLSDYLHTFYSCPFKIYFSHILPLHSCISATPRTLDPSSDQEKILALLASLSFHQKPTAKQKNFSMEKVLSVLKNRL